MTMLHIETQPSSRWVACIDLLGFSALVQSQRWPEILATYEQALEQVSEGHIQQNPRDYAWFSDSFVIYSQDDSPASFVEIESRCRWFVDGLITRGIPLRGALACGAFLADSEIGVFVGPALVDAYRLCESQDWIGFSLSASAVGRMEEIELPADERLDYRYWSIPRNGRYSSDGRQDTARLPALILGGPRERLEDNACYRQLHEMREKISKDEIRIKYDNSIHFLETNGTIRTCG